MKAEDKAKELIKKFMDIDYLGYSSNYGYSEFSTDLLNKQAKQCAIICVDEIIEFCYDNFCVAHRISELKLLKEKINQL